MGYCVDQIGANFRIASENLDKALAAVKALMGEEDKMSGGSYEGGRLTERWFSWVTTEQVIHAKTLAEALWAWRWEAVVDEDGVSAIYFNGEKWGDDDKLFQALAPFVKCGSYISFRGEDGCMWQFYFEGGKMKEKQGRVIFE
jgi:hypothetical protein